ncbi:NnrS family protein [Celeribacter neptunius]|uniref:Uncharacterized protein involved in response to NO n=1 Tax=Celeribacter neptunius TaxID=588602 RepID=A0A1I3R7Z4_9RHOB|nr:NnrS family protein [Celeribacter neptunius]SFJ41902.1 uncharacterized protein involved in response to NO [Celeribacter neptunius]
MKRFFTLLLGEGFRVFFLIAVLFALVALSLWLAAYFGGLALLPERLPPTDWHAHELVFGYGGAALAGFFLTAVPNWTGAKAARHLYIGTAAAIWLSARMAVFFIDFLPIGVVSLLALSFAPFLGAKIALQLIRKPKLQNLVFLIFLAAFWTGDLLVQLDWLDLPAGDAATGLRVGLLALVSMIIVLGGRVAPAFTRNAMHRAGIEKDMPSDPQIFTPLAIAAGLVLPLSELVFGDSWWTGSVMILSGGFVLLRGLKWHTRFQWTQPILWTLHLSYGAVGLGLLLWGGALMGIGDDVAALHFLAIGGVGGMTVSVMSRASLGHAGRPLVAPGGVALAYLLLPCGALLRWAGGWIGGAAYVPLVLLSGLIWCLAFALVAAAFWPILTSPRPPRAPVGPPPVK